MEAMLDFETMGTSRDCAVVQIGAVLFNKDEIVDEFKVNVDLSSELNHGFKRDASTSKWWREQPERTWEEDPKLDSFTAFNDLVRFLSRATRVWSHATFDAVILAHHLKVLKIRSPIKYANYLDLRTLTFMTTRKTWIPEEERPEGVHDALVDAWYQAEWAMKCFAILRGEDDA